VILPVVIPLFSQGLAVHIIQHVVLRMQTKSYRFKEEICGREVYIFRKRVWNETAVAYLNNGSHQLRGRSGEHHKHSRFPGPKWELQSNCRAAYADLLAVKNM
jgi:hypothetical protein